MGKKKFLLCSVAIICFIIFVKKIFFQGHLNLSDEAFNYINQCPACYGNNLCPQFYHGDISLSGISRLKMFTFLNSKNVFGGKFNNERVILKKLAHDWEIIDKDILICKKTKLDPSCNVKEALELTINGTFHGKNKKTLVEVLNYFDSVTDISQCPSERLLSYILNKMYSQQKISSVEEMHLFKIGEMMYGMLVNPEALILQAFTQAEGWPFPHYFGACGRIIVEEYVGRTIANYEDDSWPQRLEIAYQLLLIAQMLTENYSHFAFYMTDVNMDNFAVRYDGTVLLIDVESIVIVDRLEAKKGEKFSKELHHSTGEFCKDCLNFSYEELCNSELSDHNYYAVCKGLLVPNSYYSSKGFLHSIPEKVDKLTNLSSLLQECAEPKELFSRFHVVPKIMQVMKSLM